MNQVTTLMANALHVARQNYHDLYHTWVRISWKIGSGLPDSLLAIRIQEEGGVDLVIRCLEDEMATVIEGKARDQNSFDQNWWLHILSVYWIGGMYEIFRLLQDRKIVEIDGNFSTIFRRLELLRISLEKHEIAKDRRFNSPLKMVRYPRRHDETDTYVYDRNDAQRAHIMRCDLSERGSLKWEVTDAGNQEPYWVERRGISDQIIALWRAVATGSSQSESLA